MRSTENIHTHSNGHSKAPVPLPSLHDTLAQVVSCGVHSGGGEGARGADVLGQGGVGGERSAVCGGHPLAPLDGASLRHLLRHRVGAELMQQGL